MTNPEIRGQGALGNDAKWKKRIEAFEKKRAEFVTKKLTENADFKDEFGPRAVAVMKVFKELGGLEGLSGQPVGFEEEEYARFTPQGIVAEVETDSDGIVFPDDIKQAIANCYWVASLMAILEDHPDFLEKAVRPFDKATKPELDQTLDWYEVDVYPENFLGYRKETLLVSNNFPSWRMSTPDGKVTPDELKAMLFEKAFALWQGGYDEHEWGLSGAAMAGMTGRSASHSFVPGQSEDAVWESLNKKKAGKEAVVAIVMNQYEYLANQSFLPEKARKKYQELAQSRSAAGAGLTNKHCYSVVKTAEEIITSTVERDGQRVAEERLTKVVYLRDPRRPASPIRVTLEDFCKCVMLVASVRVRKAEKPN